MGWIRKAEPLVPGIDIGRRSDGRRLVLPFPYLPHMLVSGATGSGKSGVLNALLYALSWLQNVALVGIDLKAVEFNPWAPRLTLLTTDGTGIDPIFAAMRSELERRERLLVELGERRWRAEFGPWLVFMIDEFAEMSIVNLARMMEISAMPESDARDRKLTALTKLTRQGLVVRSGVMESFARKSRALGFIVVIATQYPTSDVIDTQVRSQCIVRIQARVGSQEQIKVGLGDGMEEDIEVGDISPYTPGVFHCAGLEHSVFTARASWISDDLVTQRVADTSHLRVEPHVLFPETFPAPVSAHASDAEESIIVTDRMPAPTPDNGSASLGAPALGIARSRP